MGRIAAALMRLSGLRRTSTWSSAVALVAVVIVGLPMAGRAATPPTTRPAAVLVLAIDPPEAGFFAKRAEYDGIPIKAHRDVADAAFAEAVDRLSMMMGRLPNVSANLRAAGAELHIIGKDQVTSDLPEHRQLKGKPFDGKLTVDQRTRGLGGLLTSCGEENLLRLPEDRYRGRDICIHEWAHNIYNNGCPASFRKRVRAQYHASLDKDRWTGAYAATNDNEYFAELTMWYFGTHGDMGMKGPKPAPGRDALKAYDPGAFALLDDFYSGRIEIPLMKKGAGGED